MNPKLKTTLLQICVSLIPIAYFLLSWNNMIEIIPMHYNSEGPDRFGSKGEMFLVLIFVACVSVGTSLALRYSDRIDPKYKDRQPGNTMIKISWVITIFISCLSLVMVYMTLVYSKSGTTLATGKYIPLMICLMFIVLANFMNTLKPSYFVGFRTPWALANEENWRKTHSVGSKIMFFTGIVMAVLILALPESLTQFVFLTGTAIVVVLPFAYSYNLFRKERKVQ